MASILKIKRSSVLGKNPTTSEITAGELALNTRDGKLFSSDGSLIFEVGANLHSLSVGSGGLVIANGSITFPTSDGSAGQLIKTNGSGVLSFTDTAATGASWSALTGTNTAIRTLVSDRMQVANTTTLLSDKFDKTGGVISGHIIPSANITYDLGSTAKAFRDLYLSGSTINLAGTKLQDDAGKLKIIDSSTSRSVEISASAGVVLAGTTAIDSTGKLDVDQTGGGFVDSTLLVFPEGNLDGTDTFIGESGISSNKDAFGVVVSKTFDCMEPKGRYQTTDLGFV
jgi:hypothetical protein